MKIKENNFFFAAAFFYFLYLLQAMFACIDVQFDFLKESVYILIMFWVFIGSYCRSDEQRAANVMDTHMIVFFLINITPPAGWNHSWPMLLLILNYIAYRGYKKPSTNDCTSQKAQQETVLWQTAAMFSVLLLFALTLNEGAPLYEFVRAVGEIWNGLTGYAMLVYLTLGALVCVLLFATIHYIVLRWSKRKTPNAGTSFFLIPAVLTLSSCGFAFYFFSYSRSYLPTFFFWIFAGSIYYLYAYLPKVGFNLFEKTDETKHGYLLLRYSVLLSVCTIGYAVFYFYTLFQQPELFAQTFLYDAKADLENFIKHASIYTDSLYTAPFYQLFSFDNFLYFGLELVLLRLFYFGFDVFQYHIPALYNILFDPLTQMFAVLIMFLSIYVCCRPRANLERYRRWHKPLAFINIGVFFVPMFHTVAYKTFQYFSQFYAQSMVAGCAFNYLLFLSATAWFYYRIYKEE